MESAGPPQRGNRVTPPAPRIPPVTGLTPKSKARRGHSSGACWAFGWPAALRLGLCHWGCMAEVALGCSQAPRPRPVPPGVYPGDGAAGCPRDMAWSQLLQETVVESMGEGCGGLRTTGPGASRWGRGPSDRTEPAGGAGGCGRAWGSGWQGLCDTAEDRAGGDGGPAVRGKADVGPEGWQRASVLRSGHSLRCWVVGGRRGGPQARITQPGTHASPSVSGWACPGQFIVVGSHAVWPSVSGVSHRA